MEVIDEENMVIALVVAIINTNVDTNEILGSEVMNIL